MKRFLWTCLFIGVVAYLSFVLEFPPTTTEKTPVKVFSNSQSIVAWAKEHLPQTGILEVSDGFVYLKVDDRYIHELFPMLHRDRYEKPPYFRRPTAAGAHISVLYLQDIGSHRSIPELGHKFSFTLMNIVYVPPRYRNYIVLEVKSLELEALREKYGLPPLLKGHEFHITIAKKKY